MKIDIAEVPKIRDLLSNFLLHSHDFAAVQSSTADKFRAEEEGGVVAYEMSKDELLSVMQARIDKTLKKLNSTYYIEFKILDPMFTPSAPSVDVSNVDEGRVVAPA